MSRKKFVDFTTAKEFAHSLNLKGKSDWAIWAKSNNRPKDIPAAPQRTYNQKGWQGWGDFLGTGTVAPQNRVFRSFEDARTFVHLLRFKNQAEWRKWTKSTEKPSDIPAYPDEAYAKEGW